MKTSASRHEIGLGVIHLKARHQILYRLQVKILQPYPLLAPQEAIPACHALFTKPIPLHTSKMDVYTRILVIERLKIELIVAYCSLLKYRIS